MSDGNLDIYLAFALVLIAVLGIGYSSLNERVRKLENEIYVRGQGWRKPE